VEKRTGISLPVKAWLGIGERIRKQRNFHDERMCREYRWNRVSQYRKTVEKIKFI
jgi:hypothetical protein